MDRLDERDKEVKQLLLAGEAALQSNTGSTSPLSSLIEESPLGFRWEVDKLPDFADVLDVVVRGNKSLQAVGQAKCMSGENSVECSPLKRTRSQGYEKIGQDARGLASMMAGMTQRLARLSDPKYLDELLTLQASKAQPEESVHKQTDEGSPSEVELLREENRKLKESLAESQREKAEMSKVLHVLEDRLAKSNEYLKSAFHSEDAKPSMCTLRSGKAPRSSPSAAGA